MISLETVNKIVGMNAQGKRLMQVSLNADTAAEIEAIGTHTSSIEGMALDTELAAFSDAFTADKELLILGSDGNWK